MFCIKCAQELPENSVACWKCGHQFIPQVQPISKVEPDSKKTTVIIQKGSAVGAFFSFIGFLIILSVVCVGGYVIYQKVYHKPLFSLNVDNNGMSVDVNLPEQPYRPSNPPFNPTRNASKVARNAVNEVERNSYSSNTCEVTQETNLKRNCDSENCDDDPNTVVIKLTQGSTVGKTNLSPISSRYSYLWIPVQVSAIGIEDGIYYIASKRLNCN